MTELIQYIAIFAPSLAAILGVVVIIVCALARLSTAIASIKKDVDVAQLSKQLSETAATNQELTKTNKVLLDRVTSVNDYVDNLTKSNKED